MSPAFRSRRYGRTQLTLGPHKDATFYLWFESFPIVFAQYHGFNLGVSQLPFLAFLVTGGLTLLGTFSASGCFRRSLLLTRTCSRHSLRALPEVLLPAEAGELELAGPSRARPERGAIRHALDPHLALVRSISLSRPRLLSLCGSG